MYTECIKIDDLPASGDAIARAASLLRSGQLVAIPTETVYGLAASAFDGEAVKRIFEAKGRPQDNPLISHISDIEMWGSCAKSIPDDAYRLAEAFWPGPLTIILEKADAISPAVTCGMPSCAVRMPSHPVARAVIAASGLPLAAPSANLSGKPSPTAARHVMDDLSGRIPLVLDAGPCGVGVESTVISLTGPTPTVLRPGIISLAELRAVLPGAEMSAATAREPAAGERVESPGMKYKHYAPRAEVTIVKGPLDAFVKYITPLACEGAAALCFEGEGGAMPIPYVCYGAAGDPASQARGLFAALRELDDLGMERAYARCPDTDASEEGYAVYNRLLRAAAFRVADAGSDRE